MELRRGKDALAQWAKSHPSLFKSVDNEAVFPHYAAVVEWVQHSAQFHASAKQAFQDGADGWIVAYAIAFSSVVVTQEVFKHDVKRQVPIPNVCQQFHVPYCDTFEMIRASGIKFF